MAPNAPPQPAAPASDDADLQHVNPKFPKVAAGFTLLAGALGMLTGTQALLTVRIFSPFWAVAPYALLALGATLIVLARFVFTARAWAAIGAMAVGGMLAVASGGWLFFATSNGFIALYAIWTPVWALLGVALSGVALPPCLRAEGARARLRADGLGLGL